MNVCKKFWLIYQIKKHERFLIEEGFRRLDVLHKPITYLEVNMGGKTDISPLVALGAEENPEEARKYVVYTRMLDRLKRN